MKLINQYKTLNAEEKDLLHGIFASIPLMFVFLWFVFTANPRQAKSEPKTENAKVQSYELPASYLKYSQRIYNEKYGN